MKLIKYVSVAAFAAILPFGTSSARAVSATPIPVDTQADAQQGLIRVESYWNEDRKEHIRHAYWILEGADRDYHGHKAAAMEQLKKAGDIIGMKLHEGRGYGGERQKWSDEQLREAKRLINEVTPDSHGKEHEHLRNAVEEINHALEIH
jgi:hypothetical protein